MTETFLFVRLGEGEVYRNVVWKLQIDRYTTDRPRQPAHEVKLMLSRVPWSLAQISCLFCKLRFLVYFATGSPSSLGWLPLCHMIAYICVHFGNPGPKIQGPILPYAPSPKKFGGQKHAKFGLFQTTTDFHCEYLRDGWKYAKLERRDRHRFLPHLAKKSGEQQSSTHKFDMWVWTTHMNFSRRPYFGP